MWFYYKASYLDISPHTSLTFNTAVVLIIPSCRYTLPGKYNNIPVIFVSIDINYKFACVYTCIYLYILVFCFKYGITYYIHKPLGIVPRGS